ncbi:hypothetical protein [Asticcacaulis sp.]|uniref:hypothetical protein n=1 Tax=Asticcacaulis sp. TaxID=1872648 RepID=UPI002C359105|nr:hypothetical protein [Asticcacaulis sp.]HTM82233.1 hypothetical protein [Asticcacaulis sp.]
MPEDNEKPPDLSDAETVIRALEALATECDHRKLTGFAKRIRLCITKCQSDYITLQRHAFATRARKPRGPPRTTH